MRNTSSQTASSNSNPQTFLRGCTRLDPLTFMLFGASDVVVTNHGVQCDHWLPMVGNLDALDSVESLKRAMDACMLRVFEGIGKTPRRGGSSRFGNQHQGQGQSQNYQDQDVQSLRNDLSLSIQEIEEFQSLTSGIVHVLDSYAQERAENASQSTSRASTRPATPNSGFYGGGNSYSNSAPQSSYGGGISNNTGVYLPPNFGRGNGSVGGSGPPSSFGGSGYNSPYGGGPAIPNNSGPGIFHQQSSGLNPNSGGPGGPRWSSSQSQSNPHFGANVPDLNQNWRGGR